MEKIILEILSFITSAVAILLSYRTYLRQKTFENENHIFKYKLEKYHDILSHIIRVYPFMEKWMESIANEFDKQPPPMDKIELMQEQFEIEFETLEYEIIMLSAFVPQKVFLRIEDFLNELPEIDLPDKYDDDYYLKKYDELDQTEEILFAIAETMRNDLGIDSLNIKLRKRTHERQA